MHHSRNMSGWIEPIFCGNIPDHISTTSTEELYVLSNSYSNENKAFDRRRLWRESVASKQSFFHNVLLSNMFVFNLEVTGSSLTEPGEASWTQV